MKRFTVQYGNNSITVENSVFHEALYVNGQLQDHAWGIASRSLLWGRCQDVEGTELTIKVRIGGLFCMSCDVFANDRLIMHQGTPINQSKECD